MYLSDCIICKGKGKVLSNIGWSINKVIVNYFFPGKPSKLQHTPVVCSNLWFSLYRLFNFSLIKTSRNASASSNINRHCDMIMFLALMCCKQTNGYFIFTLQIFIQCLSIHYIVCYVTSARAFWPTQYQSCLRPFPKVDPAQMFASKHYKGSPVFLWLYKKLLSFIHFYVRNMGMVFPFQEGVISREFASFLWLTLEWLIGS